MNPPRLAWRKIKNKILSRDYDLSLVFIADKGMSRLNSIYRTKFGPSNVLAFPLTRKSGEIFIDLPLALRESSVSRKEPREHIKFLYIHALLHLKGFKHTTPRLLKIMQKLEQKWLKILS